MFRILEKEDKTKRVIWSQAGDLVFSFLHALLRVSQREQVTVGLQDVWDDADQILAQALCDHA